MFTLTTNLVRVKQVKQVYDRLGTLKSLAEAIKVDRVGIGYGTTGVGAV